MQHTGPEARTVEENKVGDHQLSTTLETLNMTQSPITSNLCIKPYIAGIFAPLPLPTYIYTLHLFLFSHIFSICANI